MTPPHIPTLPTHVLPEDSSKHPSGNPAPGHRHPNEPTIQLARNTGPPCPCSTHLSHNQPPRPCPTHKLWACLNRWRYWPQQTKSPLSWTASKKLQTTAQLLTRAPHLHCHRSLLPGTHTANTWHFPSLNLWKHSHLHYQELGSMPWREACNSHWNCLPDLGVGILVRDQQLSWYDVTRHKVPDAELRHKVFWHLVPLWPMTRTRPLGSE